MVAVALPRIVDDLGTSISASAWLVSGYLIAQTEYAGGSPYNATAWASA